MTEKTDEKASIAQKITLWADELRDISTRGKHFADNIYDRENYHNIQSIALKMLSLSSATPLEQLEPLRANIFAGPTPHTVGDAAVIDQTGNILLIRRADSGKWAMPGGMLEVGETAAAGTEREALEETGVHCRARALVGVFDSRQCDSFTHHLYGFVFLCDPLDVPTQAPSHANEILDSRWFPETELPADLATAHRQRITEAYRIWHGESHAYFDSTPSP